mmetsp:Transcript_64094/g.202774  ORF Transcript_64094/g.202774 Transcript_64094/m.202774 type:complete len:260 (+) Transcript_64094:330-1109(+)
MAPWQPHEVGSDGVLRSDPDPEAHRPPRYWGTGRHGVCADWLGEDGRLPGAAPRRHRLRPAGAGPTAPGGRTRHPLPPLGPRARPHPRACHPDRARGAEAHPRRPQRHALRLRLRWGGATPPARPACLRPSSGRGDTGQAHGLPRAQADRPERHPLPGARRGGPHVGHGIRAAAPQDRVDVLAAPRVAAQDAHVLRHLPRQRPEGGRRVSRPGLRVRVRGARGVHHGVHHAARDPVRAQPRGQALQARARGPRRADHPR